MSEAEKLNKNIKDLNKLHDEISKKLSLPIISFDNIESKFLTNRQIMKKVIMYGGDISGVPPDIDSNKSFTISEKSAQEIVYGTTLVGNDGSFLDNEEIYDNIVDYDKTMIKDNHPMLIWIENTKEEVKKSIDELSIKSGEIVQASVQLGVESAAAFITIGSSVAILPFGAGVPTAFSAILSVFSNLQSFQTKINQIIPILKPLTFISILIPNVDSFLIPVNLAVTTIMGALTPTYKIIDILDEVKKLLPIPSGIGKPGDEIYSPAKTIKLDITKTQVSKNGNITLTVNATEGTWNYSYSWTSNDTSFHSTEKTIIVSPVENTYLITVTDSNDNKANGEISVFGSKGQSYAENSPFQTPYM